MPATTTDLITYLDKLGIASTTVDHVAVHTVEQSQHLRGDIPGPHTKNLFVKDKKGAIFLVTAKEDTAINLKHLHKHIGASGRVSFGKPELLMETLGVLPGAVTAFGLINDTAQRVSFVLDAALTAFEIVNAHPLVNTATTTIATDDLLAFARATGHDPLVLPLADL
ncbi:MAG: prolyl-tRNA synthetase associated domain-containing protein [Alphaproteobacteria bacterium]